jgi:hypothetical protein
MIEVGNSITAARRMVRRRPTFRRTGRKMLLASERVISSVTARSERERWCRRARLPSFRA